MRCTYCGSRFHTVNLCPKTWGGSSERLHLRCTYCGDNGHSSEVCPKTYGGASESKTEDGQKKYFKDYWLR